MARNALVQLGIDLFKGNHYNFSADEMEDKLRNGYKELMGGYTDIFKAFRAKGHKFFEVLEETLDVLIEEGLKTQYDPFVDLRFYRPGQKPMFMVDDYSLFKVSTIASGNNTIDRQRLDRTGFTVPTRWEAIKIYEEFERFLAGEVDWVRLIQKVYRSFDANIASDINLAITAGYADLGAAYKHSGAWDLQTFNNIVDHVEAATGQKAWVAGPRQALQKVSPSTYTAYSGEIAKGRNDTGYFKVIDGTTFVELKQSHIPGTDTFAIANQLLILPAGDEKIVKLVVEGSSQIINSMDANSPNADDSVEFTFKKKHGVRVLTASRYGMYIPS